MNECFERNLYGCVHLADFIQSEFSREYQLVEAGFLEEMCPCAGADVALG